MEENLENEQKINEIDKEMEKIDSEEAEKFAKTNNPYPTTVAFAKDQYSLFEITRQIREKQRIKLNPDYQRYEGLWNRKKQSRLIESILMGIPIPVFYFAANIGGGLSVVDGLQRLHTITEYITDNFKLTGLTYFNKDDRNMNNKSFKDLPDNYKEIIENYQIQVYILDVNVPDTVKLDIFERINSGGTPLNKQEIRHALYQGKSTTLLEELSQCHEFKDAIGTKLDTKRMRDRYVILRGISFYLSQNTSTIKNIPKDISNTDISGSLDNFLSNYMRIINKMEEEEIKNLTNTFKNSMELLYSIYKDNAFKKDKTSNTFNMVMFESLFFITASLENKINIDDDTWKRELNSIIKEETYKSTIQQSPSSMKAIKKHFDFLSNHIEQLKDKYKDTLCLQN